MAPRYVANELAATRQAAETHRNAAALRTAEAANVPTDDRPRLEREAAEAAALARVLDARAAELEIADQARSRWLVHTAATRASADRASAELTARRANADNPEPDVTAEQWLEAHDAAMRTEDEYREITNEVDFADDRPAAEPTASSVVAEDVRDIAAGEPPAADEDAERVPSGDESAESIRRAQRALTEIRAREAADQERELREARVEQMSRWHVDDHSAEHHAEAELDDAGPAMEMEPR